jgi:hypothetical protein
MTNGDWRSTPVVAWTQHEGPEAPKRTTSVWPWYTTAATLGIVFSIVFFSDSLCAEHRAWVDALGTFSLVFTVTAMVGLFRGWSIAPFVALAAATGGVAIGIIDAAHEPLRGGIVASGFICAQVLGAYLAYRQVSLFAWDRRLKRETTFSPEHELPLAANDVDRSAASSSVDEAAKP